MAGSGSGARFDVAKLCAFATNDGICGEHESNQDNTICMGVVEWRRKPVLQERGEVIFYVLWVMIALP
jgi:hypothetical protein